VEELPPVFADEDIRLEMSSRFKSEGNEKFTAGDYDRSDRGGEDWGQSKGQPIWIAVQSRERTAKSFPRRLLVLLN